MKPLLTKENRRLLEHLGAKKTLLAFDFDGTLAKITAQPHASFLTNKTAHLLERLSRYSPIAVISGRSVSDLKVRLPFSPHYLIGNHGLEGLVFNPAFLQHAQETCSYWIQNILKSDYWSDTFDLENKTYSLAIHYRRSPSPHDARLKLLKIAYELSPAARVISGKSVINLLPPGAPHKGLAVEELLAQSHCDYALYIGDDDTDEDVFSFPDPRIFSVRVGYKKSSRAQFYIPCQTKIDTLLALLIQVHSPHALTPPLTLGKLET